MPLARPVLLLFAVLDDHDAFLAGLVDHPRVTHLADRNDIAELQEAIGGILEMGAVANVGVHPDREAGRINLRAEVDYVPAEVARVDLGRVDLNDGDVLSESEGTNTELERRSKGNVAEDAPRWFGPLRVDLLVEGPKTLLRRVPETLGLGALVLNIISLPPLHHLATQFLVLGDQHLPLDGRDEILVGSIAEEGHFVARLTGILVLDRRVLRQAQWEDDVPRGDEEDLVSNARPNDIEAACSFPLTGTDGEAEHVGDRCKGIRQEGQCKKLRADKFQSAQSSSRRPT